MYGPAPQASGGTRIVPITCPGQSTKHKAPQPTYPMGIPVSAHKLVILNSIGIPLEFPSLHTCTGTHLPSILRPNHHTLGHPLTYCVRENTHVWEEISRVFGKPDSQLCMWRGRAVRPQLEL